MNIKNVFILIALVGLTGCTGMRPGGYTSPGTDTVVGSTVLGAGTGAAIGALAGGGPGAAIGALAGGAAGAGVGMGINAANEKDTARVVAMRDPVNKNYVINPYDPGEKLYVGDAMEGTVKRDPVGRVFVVGP